jgi:Fe-S-cluster containining protein
VAKSLKAKKSIYCSTVCRAWCCKNLIMEYHEQEKDIDQFFKLRDIEYDPDTHKIVVKAKCRWLTNQNKCRLYAWRPYSCRAYECDKLKSMTLQ